MKRPFAKFWLVALCLTALLPVSIGRAQQPKLDIKALAGVNVAIYDSLREIAPGKERFGGWLAGFGARISKRKAFAEVLFTFNRFATRVGEDDEPVTRVNSFELPLILGYIPYRVAKFGLFLYGGYVNRFNVAVKRGKERLKIRETIFRVYQPLTRFGASFDLYMFNFDFNYSIGLNSATRTTYRTRYQSMQVNLAYLF